MDTRYTYIWAFLEHEPVDLSTVKACFDLQASKRASIGRLYLRSTKEGDRLPCLTTRTDTGHKCPNKQEPREKLTSFRAPAFWCGIWNGSRCYRRDSGFCIQVDFTMILPETELDLSPYSANHIN